MSAVTALFWDMGGVLLTNGWDTDGRRQAAAKFNMDWDEFQERHQLISTEFETGHLSLDDYLECTVFYKTRDFCKESFQEFMFSRSQPYPETLEIVDLLSRSGKYLMSTLNNESRELNLHRIEKFNLKKYFTAFFSSCFLAIKKPEKGIYEVALNVTQRKPEECVYVDDRALNLETAKKLGVHTIHFQNAEQLRQDLKRLGVEI